MKVQSFTTRLIQLNTYLLYFPPDHQRQQVTSFLMMISRKVSTTLCWEIDSTGKQLHSWSYPFYGRILWDGDWNFFKVNPCKCTLKKKKKTGKKVPREKTMTFNGSEDEDSEKNPRATVLSISWQRGHTTDVYTKLKALVKQEKQRKGKHFKEMKRYTKHEMNVMIQNKGQKSH